MALSFDKEQTISSSLPRDVELFASLDATN